MTKTFLSSSNKSKKEGNCCCVTMKPQEVRKRIPRVVTLLKKELEIDEGPPWNRRDAFQCLIGTVLSARTKDENTAKATQALFERYPDAMGLAAAPIKEVEKIVRPSGFYKVKARRIKGLAKYLLQHHNGNVPEDMEILTNLPGVGRKTAGCVLVYSFGRPAIPTDTHVHRLSNRIGLVRTKNPERTEAELMRVVPRKYWIILNHLFVRFGQRICKPIRPECWHCPIVKLCDYPDKNLKPRK
jgi:endonuclease-3